MSEEGLLSCNCPHCNTNFELPLEFQGKNVECSYCKGVFVVPVLGDYEEHDILDMSGGETAIKGEDPVDSTTVRISRMSIGMLPDSDDDDEFKVVRSTRTIDKEEIPARKKKFFLKKKK